MPIRRITIDFTAENPVGQRVGGYLGEHNATELLIIPPPEMTENAAVTAYAAVFTTGGKRIVSRTYGSSEAICVPIWQQLTQNPVLNVQLEAYDDGGELVAKSQLVYLALLPAARGTDAETDYGENGIAAEIAANTKSRHEHGNKPVLDRLGIGNSTKLTLDGKTVENVYVGETEPTDDNAEVWINPHAEVGTGYPLVKTKTVQCPSEGDFYYYDTFSSAFVTIKNTATDKLIPPNAKIIGIDFVVAGVHYYNSEIKKAGLLSLKHPFPIEFFPRHNDTPIENKQTIAQFAMQEASQLLQGISSAGGVTEFTVYYFEELGDLAVVKVKDSNGEWQYATTASGEKGDTPIRGVDYWTAADKQEIVSKVLGGLPKWTGGSY